VVDIDEDVLVDAVPMPPLPVTADDALEGNPCVVPVVFVRLDALMPLPSVTALPMVAAPPTLDAALASLPVELDPVPFEPPIPPLVAAVA